MPFPQEVVEQICTVCSPLRVILYGEKRTLATDKLKAASLCIIVPDTDDKNALLRRLYLAVSADLPVGLTLYTADEWEELLEEPTSYAAWIDRKGRVIYEPGA